MKAVGDESCWGFIKNLFHVLNNAINLYLGKNQQWWKNSVFPRQKGLFLENCWSFDMFHILHCRNTTIGAALSIRPFTNAYALLYIYASFKYPCTYRLISRRGRLKSDGEPPLLTTNSNHFCLARKQFCK